jgi:hypothetical protein
VLSYGIGARPGDYYPGALRTEIDRANAPIYDTQQPVYKASFAGTQEAYEAAVVPLFESLDWLEERLGKNRFLVGDSLRKPIGGSSPHSFGSPPVLTGIAFLTGFVTRPGAWSALSGLAGRPPAAPGTNRRYSRGCVFQLHPFSRSM